MTQRDITIMTGLIGTAAGDGARVAALVGKETTQGLGISPLRSRPPMGASDGGIRHGLWWPFGSRRPPTSMVHIALQGVHDRTIVLCAVGEPPYESVRPSW